MKKIFIAIIVLLFSTQISTVFAQTQEASPSGETSRIEKFKEMLTKKVADLKLTEKRGLLGTVSESSTTQIILLDRKNDERTIEIDELTKFQDPTNKTFGVSDIKEGDILSVIGWYNKETEVILARSVTRIKSLPTQIDGVVSAKDTRNFTLTVVTEDNKTYIVDIETVTRTSDYARNDILKRGGFSKIIVGERVIATGFLNQNDQNRLAASRVIRFIDIPASQKMKNLARIENTTVATGINN